MFVWLGRWPWSNRLVEAMATCLAGMAAGSRKVQDRKGQLCHFAAAMVYATGVSMQLPGKFFSCLCHGSRGQLCALRRCSSHRSPGHNTARGWGLASWRASSLHGAKTFYQFFGRCLAQVPGARGAHPRADFGPAKLWSNGFPLETAWRRGPFGVHIAGPF